MCFLAIDPGNDTGWAVLGNDGQLQACLVGNPPMIWLGCAPKVVIIEKPVVYPSRNSKGNPNDLITLALQVGRYSERFASRNADIVLVEPREWKGTIDKSKHHERIWCTLSPKEQAMVGHAMTGVAVSKRHNAMDAVGLAKWAYSQGKFR